MQGQHYGIDAEVKIITNRAHAGRTGDKVVFDSRTRAGKRGDRGLRCVTVTNSINAAAGTCVLEFAPEAVTDDGRSWAEAILPRSLVSVAFWRYGHDGAATEAPEPVFLGFVDSPETSADYSGPEPVRSNRLVCRALNGILADQKWFAHHWGASLRENGQAVFNTPPQFARFFPEKSQEELALELSLRDAGLMVVNPDIKLLSERFPPDLMELLYRFFVGGESDKFKKSFPPFIKVKFADDAPLAQRLRFDHARAVASFVDSNAFMMAPLTATALQQASCWQFLRQFSDPYLQELYSDTFGDSVDSAYCDIISRKRPFAGHLEYPGPRIGFATTSRQRPTTYGQSLFDEEWGLGWLLDADTVTINAGDSVDLKSENLTRGSGEIYSLYSVWPPSLSGGANSTSHVSWQAITPFIVDEFADSPSRVDVYGANALRHQPCYVSGLQADDKTPRPQGDVYGQAVAYEALLWEWHHRNPEMWRGNIECKGRTAFRAGRRLVDAKRKREYYITGVRHRMSFSAAPTYTTTLQVERGWDLERV